MSDFKRFYDEEMRYLLGAGKEFAQDHPEAARLLSLDEIEDRDPYVERLFGNFAFLSAKIRQTLDEDDDGLAHQMLDHLAPGLETPMPSVAVVEFSPDPNSPEAATLGGNMEIHGCDPRSDRVCRFSLVNDLNMFPLALRSARLTTGPAGRSVLEWSLQALDKNGTTWPETLRVFLNGDPSVVWAVRFWLLRQVLAIEVVSPDGTRYPCAPALVPPSPGRGYSAAISAQDRHKGLLLMRDFFCAEEGFRFVELTGLPPHSLASATSVSIRIIFRGAFPRTLEKALDASLFKLHTTPVVNGFTQECIPMALDTTRVEYPLAAMSLGHSAQVLEARSVWGASQTDPTRSHAYTRLSAYRHLGQKDIVSGFYETKLRPRRSGDIQAMLSVGHQNPDSFFHDEYLSVAAYCSNGDFPREALQPADLHRLGPGLTGCSAVKGLTRPTAEFRPPEGGQYRWKLLAHLQHGFKGLLDPEALRETLRQLLWDPKEAKRSLVEAIHTIECATTYRLHKGVPKPVLALTVVLRDENCTADSWDRLGLIDAFGALLFELYREEAPQGHGIALQLRLEPSARTLEFGA